MKWIKIKYYLMLLLAVFFLQSCSEKNLSENRAIHQIETYLSANPMYETADIAYGEVKFRAKADENLLKAYKELESLGYIEIVVEKEHKRFLSKDSAYIYIVKFTDKSIPFILEKGTKKAKVKTYYYELDKSNPVHIEQKGKNKAAAVTSLKKQQTDFYKFSKDKNPHATFIKRDFSLKFDKNEGWVVTK